jgi:MFS family permease
MTNVDTEFNHKTGIFSVIKRDFFSIPVSIRMISLSMFLFILWRGLGGDTFFSIYLKSIINNVFWISVIGALLPFIKMFFSISVGELDDHSDIRSVIFVSKAVYVLTSIAFFLAGTQHSVTLLIVAVALNAVWWAALITSYHSMIRKLAKKNNRSTIFGLYFSSTNFAYVVWGLIAAVLIKYIDLPHLYLFVGLFTLISFLTDTKLPHLSKKNLKAFLGKESFLHQFFREVFSLWAFRKAFNSLKTANKKIYNVLGFEFLYNILNYVGFIFIPIIAVQNNLSFSQIAIIFAIMRLPYVFNFFTWEFADLYNRKKFILVVLLFISFLYALLGVRDGFISIIIISFGISLGLALIRPVISSMISYYSEESSSGKITGIEEFVARFGEVFGSLLFGVLSVVLGMGNSFIAIGIGLFIFAVIGIVRKFHIFKKL